MLGRMALLLALAAPGLVQADVEHLSTAIAGDHRTPAYVDRDVLSTPSTNLELV